MRQREAELEAKSVEWFNALPSAQVAASCILRDALGRVLIVDLAYKPQWDLPGGAAGVGESPLAACIREVEEEVGLRVEPRRLLAVDHQTMRPPRRPALRFIFDGGMLDESQIAAIVLDESELSAWQFVGVDELHDFLVPAVANRVRRGLEQPGLYLEDGLPLPAARDVEPG